VRAFLFVTLYGSGMSSSNAAWWSDSIGSQKVLKFQQNLEIKEIFHFCEINW
jgi:hypothetical protein